MGQATVSCARYVARRSAKLAGATTRSGQQDFCHHLVLKGRATRQSGVGNHEVVAEVLLTAKGWKRLPPLFAFMRSLRSERM